MPDSAWSGLLLHLCFIANPHPAAAMKQPIRSSGSGANRRTSETSTPRTCSKIERSVLGTHGCTRTLPICGGESSPSVADNEFNARRQVICMTGPQHNERIDEFTVQVDFLLKKRPRWVRNPKKLCYRGANALVLPQQCLGARRESRFELSRH